ncbi:hypothetical protein DCO58_05450 [Helicobacter saguini]|uniref:Periplasmic protein n=1 Tax=Helicobacter saguini TaxID=1548018 RepID=A0A347VT79_9HELI|nr:hypothetical protein [Helicobacter saguini]MWV62205.1 hypothetical protein [Helicobacter saguini]MWV67122.1 hypothetical protein [Helicobacter saguini]MWV69472.1 hypothetical protein [Helicobacter saguini]MWV70975.1 hypothetical protein [Helicobacter saguini]TLD92939.1 hypothetical protein LS64_009630 [Helicobacter saguini]
MKKVILLFSALGLFSSFALADCASLMKKYNAPDPGSKTMNQIKRWVKKVDDASDAKELESCMIAQAADNPNKSQVAGK